MSAFYWSSTSNANNPENAWGVNFNNGNDNNNAKSSSYYVRAVRSGKCPVLSFESIYKAYKDCRKGKRGTINAIQFDYDLIGHLFELAVEIQKGTYQPSRSVCFVTSSPKLREVFAADFRDRIVHHLIVRKLEPLWERSFIFDSHASRSDKGIHLAVKRLQKFMLKATLNQKRKAYYLQLDIRSFFMSIDKPILFKLLEKKLLSVYQKEDNLQEAWALLYLIRRTLFHNCTQNYIFKGNPEVLKHIPPHKSLFKIPPDKGLPIGNLTSQFFANVYLNELDQYVKHQLKCKFYLRYVDDFVLLSHDRQKLLNWKQSIENFTKDYLAISLKKDYKLCRVSDGADFLGYIVRPDYLLVRNRVVNNCKLKLNELKKEICEVIIHNGFSYLKILLINDLIKQLQQSLSSYLGHFSHANSYNLCKSLFRQHYWLEYFFIFDEKNTNIVDRLKCKNVFRTFRGQMEFFKSRFPNCISLFQVGRYYEIYNEQALWMHRWARLKMRENVRKTKNMVGFPRRWKDHFVQKIMSIGVGVIIIKEDGAGPFIKERSIHEIYHLMKRKEEEVINA